MKYFKSIFGQSVGSCWGNKQGNTSSNQSELSKSKDSQTSAINLAPNIIRAIGNGELQAGDMESLRNGDLPADIIRDILLRLTVKSLSQFKCVCKQWYTLIESQSFVNEHFVCKSNRERLLIFKPERDRLIYADEYSSGYEEPDHLPMPGNVYDIIGPLNGLFCLVSSLGDMGFFNPAVRQFKPLPHLSFVDRFLGFRLNPLSGDYKVVSIRLHPPLVNVYNSGSDSWRLLDDVDVLNSVDSVHRSKFNTYLNGVYYWVIRYRDHGFGSFGILAFDMSSDKFHVIRIPNALIHRGHKFKLELGLYGDSIVLLSFNSRDDSDNFIDMWVLENDGSWTKCLTYGPFRNLRSPLGFWKDSELMLETDNTLLSVYNIFTRELRHVEARGKRTDLMSYFRIWVYTYKESLVSIQGEGEKDSCKLLDISSDPGKVFFENFFR